jgi:sugar O-acyltransferase (sialic acid O-acetyltransferase NeuD family)
MAQQLIIIGAGGHARACAEIAARCGFTVVGFCDPAFALGEWINGVPVIAEDDEGLLAEWTKDTQLFVALGNNARRVELGELAQQQGIELVTLVDPTAVVSTSAEIGAGSVLMVNVVVNANTRVGAHCILNTACTIDHDGDLADGVQIGPGVHAAGGVRFGEKALAGVGASLIPGVRVGRQAIVGAGAVVTEDVPDRVTVAGVPARPISR